jgi:predicted aminopeptidase
LFWVDFCVSKNPLNIFAAPELTARTVRLNIFATPELTAKTVHCAAVAGSVKQNFRLYG